MTEKNEALVAKILSSRISPDTDEWRKVYPAIVEIVEELENIEDELRNEILNNRYTIRTLLTGNEILAQRVKNHYNDDNLNF